MLFREIFTLLKYSSLRQKQLRLLEVIDSVTGVISPDGKVTTLKTPRDVKVDGAAATEFDLGEGISITVPKPRSEVSAQLSGRMNSKGEPILYFDQSDQKKIKAERRSESQARSREP